MGGNGFKWDFLMITHTHAFLHLECGSFVLSHDHILRALQSDFNNNKNSCREKS